MSVDIQIMERPEWVSWKDIRQCLYDAHSVNRAKGINMSLYQASSDKLREYIGANGVMLVALDGNKVVGVCGMCEKKDKQWFTKGTYAQLGLGGILPEYSGHGIFRKFIQILEGIAEERSYSAVLSSTHEKNKRRIDISKANGYKLVGYIAVGDHCNVLMAKWPEGSSYSESFRRFRVGLSWITSRVKSLLRPLYHRVKKLISRPSFNDV